MRDRKTEMKYGCRVRIINKVFRLLRMKGMIVTWFPDHGAYVDMTTLDRHDLAMVYVAICAGIRNACKEDNDTELLEMLSMSPADIPDDLGEVVA